MSLDKAQDVNKIAERIHSVLLSYGESVKESQLANAMDLDKFVVMRALAILELDKKAVKGLHGWRAA